MSRTKRAPNYLRMNTKQAKRAEEEAVRQACEFKDGMQRVAVKIGETHDGKPVYEIKKVPRT